MCLLSSFFQITCNMLVHIFKASREGMFSSVSSYLTLGYIRKKGFPSNTHIW